MRFWQQLNLFGAHQHSTIHVRSHVKANFIILTPLIPETVRERTQPKHLEMLTGSPASISSRAASIKAPNMRPPSKIKSAM
jgi:hypothetical protein